jgi:CheY-like chemotaxis protein/HPt (histidine-containing phosphotransfer) domain-containing protein
VSDTGIGIASDQVERLFAKFTQADSSTTRLYGGTGLGLAISKQLIELMGGEIGVRSAPERGSEFWFTVRLAKPAVPRAEAMPISADLRGVRVLIVDSQPIHREMLLQTLKSWDMRPAEAADAPAALEALTQAQAAGDSFRMAVLESKVPGRDGESLVNTIKQNPLLTETRLVMSASLGQRVSPQRMEAAGFAATLLKPVRRQKLQEVLLQVINGGKAVVPPTNNAFASVSRETASQARILLAEDNLTNQQVAVGLLKKLGLNVEVVTDGAVAVKVLENQSYDLVLMDVQMPRMDGMQATRIIRDPTSRVLNHEVPIIALTAHAMQGDREKCRQAGMNDYITKPIEVANLAAVLEKWLTPGKNGGHLPVDKRMEPVVVLPGKTELCVFNRTAFMKRMMNDEHLAQMIIKTFVGDMPGQIAQLKELVRAGEMQQIGRQAHKIRGAAANAGGEALQALAATVEQAAKAGDAASIATQMTELDVRFAALLAALKQETGQARL